MDVLDKVQSYPGNNLAKTFFSDQRSVTNGLMTACYINHATESGKKEI